MNDYEYDHDEEDLTPPKPLPPERAAYISDLIKEISELAKELA